jgi:hypothetical protein
MKAPIIIPEATVTIQSEVKLRVSAYAYDKDKNPSEDFNKITEVAIEVEEVVVNRRLGGTPFVDHERNEQAISTENEDATYGEAIFWTTITTRESPDTLINFIRDVVQLIPKHNESDKYFSLKLFQPDQFPFYCVDSRKFTELLKDIFGKFGNIEFDFGLLSEAMTFEEGTYKLSSLTLKNLVYSANNNIFIATNDIIVDNVILVNEKGGEIDAFLSFQAGFSITVHAIEIKEIVLLQCLVQCENEGLYPSTEIKFDQAKIGSRRIDNKPIKKSIVTLKGASSIGVSDIEVTGDLPQFHVISIGTCATTRINGYTHKREKEHDASDIVLTAFGDAVLQNVTVRAPDEGFYMKPKGSYVVSIGDTDVFSSLTILDAVTRNANIVSAIGANIGKIKIIGSTIERLESLVATDMATIVECNLNATMINAMNTFIATFGTFKMTNGSDITLKNELQLTILKTLNISNSKLYCDSGAIDTSSNDLMLYFDKSTVTANRDFDIKLIPDGASKDPNTSAITISSSEFICDTFYLGYISKFFADEVAFTTMRNFTLRSTKILFSLLEFQSGGRDLEINLTNVASSNSTISHVQNGFIKLLHDNVNGKFHHVVGFPTRVDVELSSSKSDLTITGSGTNVTLKSSGSAGSRIRKSGQGQIVPDLASVDKTVFERMETKNDQNTKNVLYGVFDTEDEADT